MRSRFAAVVVALLLVVATGTARGIATLCPMAKASAGACCCKGASDPADEGDCAKLKRVSHCCEVDDADFTSSPALAKEAAPQPPAAIASWAAGFPALEAPRPARSQAMYPLVARAPPLGPGCALFVLNCQFLI